MFVIISREKKGVNCVLVDVENGNACNLEIMTAGLSADEEHKPAHFYCI